VKNEQNLAVMLDETILNFETDKGLFIPRGYIIGRASDVGGIVNGSAYPGGTESQLAEGEVIFDFQLPEEVDRYNLTSFTVYAGYNYGAYSLYLKNQITGEWDEIYLDKAFAPDALREYVDEENIVQVSVQKAAGSGDASFDRLTISVEGRVK